MADGIAVLGAGAFGTALAIVLAEAGRPVLLWGRDAAAMKAMEATRENPHLPGARLPAALRLTADPARAAADTVLLAVPTQALRGLLAGHPGLAGRRLVACCKGVERGTGLLPTEVIADVLPGTPAAVLTGPSFAADIAAGKPTALTLATADPGGEALQARLSTPALRLYLNPDPKGAQLGGALKNVIAIAAGAGDGMGFGHNSRAAVITRGLNEIARLAVARGANPLTVSGLAGMGDLVLTCTGELSRNRTVGIELGRGKKLGDILRDLGHVAEGVKTARSSYDLARSTGVEMPITEQVYRVLYEDKSVAAALTDLMSRPLLPELDFR